MAKGALVFDAYDQLTDAVLAADPKLYAHAPYMFDKPVITLGKIIDDVYAYEVSQSKLVRVLCGLRAKGHKTLVFATPNAVIVKNKSEWEKYAFTVHLFGNSVLNGAGLPDRDKPGSLLQAKINDNGLSARVLNRGVNAMSELMIANMIEDTENEFEPNDIIVVVKRGNSRFISKDFQNALRENGIDFCFCGDAFQRPHGHGEVFLNDKHLNHNGNRIVVECIYDLLFGDGLEALGCPKTYVPYYRGAHDIKPQVPLLEPFAVETGQTRAFSEYIGKLTSERKESVGIAGCIVMNCNPFTLGHRYLIEYAAGKVDRLCIFAVEEDRSIFPFADRFEMIKRGTGDLKNVTVLPSGKFIISALTFPEYFEKGDKQNETIDPSQDVELFAKYIAPALDITVRFAGEEPLDNVTRQYNEAMRGILPRYGVEFVEIPRREEAGEPISASRVRRLLEAKDFDGIKKLVPETTFEYLRKFFFWGGVLNNGKCVFECPRECAA